MNKLITLIKNFRYLSNNFLSELELLTRKRKMEKFINSTKWKPVSTDPTLVFVKEDEKRN